MKRMSLAKFMQLSTLSKPSCDRQIYKLIKRNRVRSMVEIGLENGQRAENMIRAAHRFAEGGTIRYTGIDLFEGRTNGDDSLSLISMHRTLKRLEAKTQLVPGELHDAIPRIANSHLRTDLIVISAGYAETSLEQSWFYLPRMTHANSIVLIQGPSGQGQAFESYNRLRIEQLAHQTVGSSKMAA